MRYTFTRDTATISGGYKKGRGSSQDILVLKHGTVCFHLGVRVKVVELARMT